MVGRARKSCCGLGLNRDPSNERHYSPATTGRPSDIWYGTKRRSSRAGGARDARPIRVGQQATPMDPGLWPCGRDRRGSGPGHPADRLQGLEVSTAARNGAGPSHLRRPATPASRVRPPALTGPGSRGAQGDWRGSPTSAMFPAHWAVATCSTALAHRTVRRSVRRFSKKNQRCPTVRRPSSP
jgi:hypothetical protein